jgi:hypothetical protein
LLSDCCSVAVLTTVNDKKMSPRIETEGIDDASSWLTPEFEETFPIIDDTAPEKVPETVPYSETVGLSLPFACANPIINKAIMTLYHMSDRSLVMAQKSISTIKYRGATCGHLTPNPLF